MQKLISKMESENYSLFAIVSEKELWFSHNDTGLLKCFYKS